MTAREKRARSLIALDYGRRRIGVATGSVLTGTASALTTVTSDDGTPRWRELDKIVKEWSPDLLVLGLPYNTDGSESEMTTAVREFAELLEKRYGLPLDTIDERYTSAEAETILKEQRRQGLRTRKVKKEDVDATAAQLIAESWMRTTGASSPS